MNAQPLFLKSGKSANVWYCEACRQVFREEFDAVECCTCRHCGEPCPRDSPGDYTRQHYQCFRDVQDKRMAEKLEKAEAVSKYDGYVYVDQWGPQDGYFPSAEDAEEYLFDEAEPGNRPEWAFCCTPHKIRQIDSSDICEMLHDDLYEDGTEDLQGLKELDEAFSAFFKANESLLTWTIDYTRKVRLDYSDQKAYSAIE